MQLSLTNAEAHGLCIIISLKRKIDSKNIYVSFCRQYFLTCMSSQLGLAFILGYTKILTKDSFEGIHCLCNTGSILLNQLKGDRQLRSKPFGCIRLKIREKLLDNCFHSPSNNPKRGFSECQEIMKILREKRSQHKNSMQVSCQSV